MDSQASRLSARRRGYDKAHEKWRLAVFARENSCRFCGAPGQPSDHADHIVRIREGGARFDPANGQRLCHTCHNGPKQSLDRTGVARGGDSSGFPFDPSHHWNTPGGASQRNSDDGSDRSRTVSSLNRHTAGRS